MFFSVLDSILLLLLLPSLVFFPSIIILFLLTFCALRPGIRWILFMVMAVLFIWCWCLMVLSMHPISHEWAAHIVRACAWLCMYIYLCVRSCAVRAVLFSSALAYFSLTWALAQSAFMLLYFSFRFKLVFSFSNHHPIPFPPRTLHQSHRQHLGTPAGLACV